MTVRQALAFVKRQGIVLESAHVRGVRAPTFADAVVGARVRGNWWTHPKGKKIFWMTRAVRDSRDVLVCRLVDGKITYVHRRVWPPLVRLAPEVGSGRLDAIEERHTAGGRHVLRVRRFPIWVDAATKRAANRLTPEAAWQLLRRLLPSVRKPAAGR